MKLMSSHLKLLPAILLFLVSCQSTQQPESPSNITVIEGATVIDSVSETPLEDAVIVIEGDTIRSIGRRGSVEVPANARTVDASGKTIMPGMVNLHGHIGVTVGMGRDYEGFSKERVQRDANAYLYYGITHMLSLGIDREPMFEFLADQRAGRAGGARLYSAGIGFTVEGVRPGNLTDVHYPKTPEEAREQVREELAKNVDVIKMWVDDRLGRFPKFDPEIYAAIIDEAHQSNVKVFAHMYYLEDAKELMRRGLDGLAHSVRDKEVDEEFLRLAKENGVTQLTTLAGHHGRFTYADGPTFLDDPGLAVLFPASVLETVGSKEYQQEAAKRPGMATSRKEYANAAKNAATVAAAGIPIAVGTDSGSPGHFPGLWEHREMELMVDAGLTPMQAIQAATINGAKFLGVDDRYGTLEPGKVADMIVLDADPLADITNSRKIDSVWMNGKQVNRDSLAPHGHGSN